MSGRDGRGVRSGTGWKPLPGVSAGASAAGCGRGCRRRRRRRGGTAPDDRRGAGDQRFPGGCRLRGRSGGRAIRCGSRLGRRLARRGSPAPLRAQRGATGELLRRRAMSRASGGLLGDGGSGWSSGALLDVERLLEQDDRGDLVNDATRRTLGSARTAQCRVCRDGRESLVDEPHRKSGCRRQRRGEVPGVLGRRRCPHRADSSAGPRAARPRSTPRRGP